MEKGEFRPRYLDSFRGGWRYRRVIPENLRPLFPKLDNGKQRTEWTVAFRPGMDTIQIWREVERLAAEHDLLIQRAKAGEVIDAAVIAQAERNARAKLSGDKTELHSYMAFLAPYAEAWPDRPLIAATLNALEHGGQYQGRVMTLRMAHEQRAGDRDNKPIEAALKTFEPFGGHKDVREISDDDVVAWIKACKAGTHRPAKNGHKPKPLKASAIRRRMQALHALGAFGFRKVKVVKPNPFSIKAHADHLRGGGRSKASRLPFDAGMLAAIDSYVAKSKRVRHETRNILRIMRNTGGGPAEIGGAALADVILEGPIPYIWIRANKIRLLKVREDDESEEMPARDRQVPLVGIALEAAKDAVKRAAVRSKGKNRDDVALFEGFDSDGRGADSISAKLNKAIRSAGVPRSPRLTAYSFRHAMKEALRSASVADHIQRRVLGHAGKGVADDYGSPRLKLTQARDAIKAALPYLGDVDDAQYSERERMKEAAE